MASNRSGEESDTNTVLRHSKKQPESKRSGTLQDAQSLSPEGTERKRKTEKDSVVSQKMPDSHSIEIEQRAEKLGQQDIHVNPEYEALVPKPSESEFTAIKASIGKEGQLQEIIVNDNGTVIDGHTRNRALKELKRDVKFRVVHFPSTEAERDYIIKSAVLRRNMPVFQKIVLAQYRVKEEREKARARQRQGRKTSQSKGGKVGEALNIVADEFGVRRKTFSRGQYVLEHASPEQIKNLESERATINGLFKLLNKKRNAEKGPIVDPSGNGQPTSQSAPGQVGPENKSDEDRNTVQSSAEKTYACEGGCQQNYSPRKMKWVRLCEGDRIKAGCRF